MASNLGPHSSFTSSSSTTEEPCPIQPQPQLPCPGHLEKSSETLESTPLPSPEPHPPLPRMLCVGAGNQGSSSRNSR